AAEQQRAEGRIRPSCAGGPAPAGTGRAAARKRRRSRGTPSIEVPAPLRFSGCERPRTRREHGVVEKSATLWHSDARPDVIVRPPAWGSRRRSTHSPKKASRASIPVVGDDRFESILQPEPDTGSSREGGPKG